MLGAFELTSTEVFASFEVRVRSRTEARCRVGIMVRLGFWLL